MADSKDTTAQRPQGSGPLGQSGVSPSGSVQRNYQNEFVTPRRPQADSHRPAHRSTTEKGPAGRQ
jgi:hypothetical protein